MYATKQRNNFIDLDNIIQQPNTQFNLIISFLITDLIQQNGKVFKEELKAFSKVRALFL